MQFSIACLPNHPPHVPRAPQHGGGIQSGYMYPRTRGARSSNSGCFGWARPPNLCAARAPRQVLPRWAMPRAALEGGGGCSRAVAEHILAVLKRLKGCWGGQKRLRHN